MPNSDNVVGVTGEEVLAIGRPGKGDTLWVLSLGGEGSKLRLELVHQFTLLQVVNLDSGSGSGTEPVSVWRESQSVDLVTRSEGVEGSLGVHVPQDDGTVLSTRCTQRSIWGDGNAGDVTGVANKVSLKRVVLKVPSLKS